MSKFEEVKVGDVMAVCERGYACPRKQAVTRVTKTTFTLGTKTFSRKTGRTRGSDAWSHVFAEKAE